MKKRVIKPVNLLRFLALSASILLTFGIQSCEQYEILPEEIDEEVTFTEVQAIFNNACAGCHDGVTANPVLTEGQAYNNLINGSYINTDSPEESLLYTKMKSSSHSLYSTSGERSKVLNWIENGAQNN